jgi:hypothetical protein
MPVFAGAGDLALIQVSARSQSGTGWFRIMLLAVRGQVAWSRWLSGDGIETFSVPAQSAWAMSRLALRLVLALTLILNGISAPWAMLMPWPGGTDAGTTPAMQAMTLHSGVALSEAQHDHGLSLPDASDVAAPEDCHGQRSCCTDAACHCGCLLPPVVLVTLTGLPAMPASKPRDQADGTHRAGLRHPPPLRPPTA